MFKEAIEDAEAHRYDVLVVHKIDRFSRNLKVTLECLDKLGKAGVGFVAIENNIDYTTPMGKLMLQMQGALAEFYSGNLSEEVKKGLSERRAQGLYCGLLPFGVAKGGDGIPMPHPHTHEGLVMAFRMVASGESHRVIAHALNVRGFHTAGNQRNGQFTIDTVRGILRNRFYLGELPDGDSGWLPAKHQPLIDPELFSAAQRVMDRNRQSPKTISHGARLYSLSAMMRSAKCGSRIRMQMSPHGRARVYCAGRALGGGCTCKGTFLETYEAQVRWYLETFVIPEDYQEKLLNSYRDIQNSLDDIGERRSRLQARVARLQEMYAWGHVEKRTYRREYEETQRELDSLQPLDGREAEVQRLAEFLKNVASAWDVAGGELRNRLARTLFSEILVEDSKVVAVRPQPELEPFFQLGLERHAEDIAGEPDGIRTRDLLLDREVC